MSAGNSRTFRKLTRGLRSRYPLFYFLGWEEERMESLLSLVVDSLYKGSGKLVTWSATLGFDDEVDVTAPLAALKRIHGEQEKVVYLLKDLPSWFDTDPALVRGLRDLYHDLRGRHVHVFISHPQLKLPETLKKELFLVEMALPSAEDILEQLRRQVGSGRLPEDELLHHMAIAMKGLSLNEVGHLQSRLYAMPDLDLRTALTEIQEEKSQILAKESVLRFYPPQRSLDEIGGLDNLKDWVRRRRDLFTQEALEEGVPLPAGVLFMGISGCGKSLAAKTIATAWNLPLVRLDMSLVMSGSFGSPEYAFERATRIAGEIAPVVLWIDELENAFGYDERIPPGGNVNIFSSFLTWMQEKPAGVFLAATANRIQSLPAELMRKGRFDQLFFLNLPSAGERAQIFAIHIRLNGQNPDDFDTDYLAAATRGWSGAEIEAAVKSARIEAWQEGRGFNEQDVIHSTVNMVPLSRTMEEQIQAIRDWSFQRAIPASNSK
jgi:SpoVK/Ycf46/Vps4 family AAA+-type ATPase